jgi:hypothetical protein
MPYNLNFPDDPTDGQPFTGTNGITYIYSLSNNAWTVNTTVATGVDNVTDRDDVMVKLNRVGGVINTLVPALGFTHNDQGTVKIKGDDTSHILDIANSAGTILNYFNRVGILNIAGKSYYSALEPSVSGSDYTGCLWINSTTTELFHWSGTAWVAVGSGVSLGGVQTVAGAKTFSSDVALSSAASIIGSGSSKAINLKPTTSGSVATTSFTLTTTDATFAPAVSVAFSAINTATVSTVLVDMTTAQVVNGIKTFNDVVQIGDSILYTGATSTNFNISSNSGTGDTSTANIVLRSNANANSRYIKLNEKASTTNGVTIRPKDPAGLGRVYIDGNVYIAGTLDLSGALTASAGFAAVSKTVGSLKAASGTVSDSNRIPSPIGSLTFSQSVGTPGNENAGYIRVFNTGSASASFYVTRHQLMLTGFPAFSERKITLPAGQYFRVGVSTGHYFETVSPTTGQENLLYGNSATAFDLLGTESQSLVITFSLAS